MRRIRTVPAVAVLVLACIGGVFASCSGGTSVEDADPADDAAAPAGVSAMVQYFRSDQIPHRVQLTVTNGTGLPLRVQQARLFSPRYPDQPTWKQRNADDIAVFGPGITFDLPAPLTEAACPAVDAPAPQVRLLVEGDDGETTWLRAPATDPDDALVRVQRIDCVQSATEKIASVEVQPPVPGRGRSGVIEVLLTPTGEPGTVTVEQVSGTTLLAPTRGDAWRPRTTVSAAGGPVTLRLPVRPNRCDPHAVADDKVGAMLQFDISVDGGEPGPVVFPPSTDLRNAVYAFINTTCRTTPS